MALKHTPLAILMTSFLFFATGITHSNAHMSIWLESMYGVGPNLTTDRQVGDPFTPIGPDLLTQDEWWFRGPSARKLHPPPGAVTELVAGSSVTIEIACHVAWTSFGERETRPGSLLDACPGNPGAYHSGDPADSDIDPNLLSGCALGIADVDDIEKVHWDNLVIFTVQSQCVKQKHTQFDVPAAMPVCKGSHCICAWFWLANTGTANFYMTAFNCAIARPKLSVRDPLPPARRIALPPSDPVFCPASNTTCRPVAGAKRPLYAYNFPSNVPRPDEIPDFNAHRPGYHAEWSFTVDGAQDDIFEPEGDDNDFSGDLQDMVPAIDEGKKSRVAKLEFDEIGCRRRASKMQKRWRLR